MAAELAPEMRHIQGPEETEPDPLATCPPELRERFQKLADRKD
jgi:hypothetical protein